MKSDLEAFLRKRHWRVPSPSFGRYERFAESFASEMRRPVIEVLLRVGWHSVDARSLERDVMRFDAYLDGGFLSSAKIAQAL
jgi:hypothetical protein